MAAFTRMDAMANAPDGTTPLCRPFDARRNGFVLGEGAGFLVLASETYARAAGLSPIAAVSGWGLTTDAAHVTAPDSAGGAPERCMRQAIKQAGLSPRDIRHVNAHGTGTRLNDLAEARSIAAVFGSFGVPVTANKAVTGHLMGAAGAVETVAALGAMMAQLVPPTACCEELEDEMQIDLVLGQPRKISRGPALTCSFGFGGQNAALVLTPLTR